MNYIEVQLMRKKAALGDVAAVIGPGVATGAGLWWLSGKVPWLKRQKLLRSILAGGAGTAFSIGMGKWLGEKNLALAKAVEADTASQTSLKNLVDYTMGKTDNAPRIMNFGKRIVVQ